MKYILFLAVGMLFFNQSVFAQEEESTAGWSIQITNPFNNATIYLLGASSKGLTVTWTKNTGGSSQYRVRYSINGDEKYYGTGSSHGGYPFPQGQYTLLVKLYQYTIAGTEVFVTQHSVTLNVHPGYRLWYNNNFIGGSVLVDGGSEYIPTVNGPYNYKYVTPGNHPLEGINNQTGSDGYKRIWKQWNDGEYPYSFLATDISYTANITRDDQGYTATYDGQPKVPTNFQNVASSGNVQLSWSAIPGQLFTENYEIQRHIIDNGGWVVIGTTTNTSFTDTQFDITAPRWATYTAEYRVRAKSNVGIYSEFSPIVTVSGISYYVQKRQNGYQEELPTEFSVEQNYPNPFNPATEIKFSIAEPSFVTLAVFNSAGQEVSQLVKEYKGIGNYAVTWNAVNLPSSVYFYSITAGKFSSQKKMMLVK